jgi:hypothetical protein
MDKVPAALADVVEPLREADEYTRLQEIRQRGFYNIVTGLPAFLFSSAHGLLPFLLGWDSDNFAMQATIQALIWSLFFVSCFPRLFLPLIRRYRPDWQSPLVEASLLKRALEKQFWFQFPFLVAYILFVPLLGVLITALVVFPSILEGRGVPEDDLMWLVRLMEILVLLAAMGVLAWQARRTRDSLLAAAFLVWIPIGLTANFLDPSSQVPSPLALIAFYAAVTTPPLIVGLIRLLAPRRWLVR